jgi:hypothetical protein
MRERDKSGISPTRQPEQQPSGWTTEEYFREMYGVMARRWFGKPNGKWDIDEAEKHFQEVDGVYESFLKGASAEERGAFYIRKTINEIKKGYMEGAKMIKAAASLIQEEYLEKMRPYDPQLVDDIISAQPNHPITRAKDERIMQRLNQELNRGRFR